MIPFPWWWIETQKFESNEWIKNKERGKKGLGYKWTKEFGKKKYQIIEPLDVS